jgi:hypothetical protein
VALAASGAAAGVTVRASSAGGWSRVAWRPRLGSWPPGRRRAACPPPAGPAAPPAGRRPAALAGALARVARHVAAGPVVVRLDDVLGAAVVLGAFALWALALALLAP